MTHAAVGNYEAAERCYKCALKLLRKHYGKRSRDVPMVLNNLGDLYYIAGREDEAGPLYRQALDIFERDQRHVEVCHSLNGLALLHNDAGEHTQAEKLLTRGIRIHEKASRREDPNLATLRVNLGALCTNLGRYDEAEVLFDKAKYIQDKVLRANHPDKAIRLHAYAGLLVRTNRIEEARQAKAEAEAIQAEQAKTNPMARAIGLDEMEQASASSDETVADT
jgi:tetratricopeptide (TPR) repeat protein